MFRNPIRPNLFRFQPDPNEPQANENPTEKFKKSEHENL